MRDFNLAAIRYGMSITLAQVEPVANAARLSPGSAERPDLPRRDRPYGNGIPKEDMGAGAVPPFEKKGRRKSVTQPRRDVSKRSGSVVFFYAQDLGKYSNFFHRGGGGGGGGGGGIPLRPQWALGSIAGPRNDSSKNTSRALTVAARKKSSEGRSTIWGKR